MATMTANDPMSRQETANYDPLGTAKDKAYAALPDIIKECAKDCPSVGKHIRVTQGKYKGMEGVVFWHGVDRWSPAGRYGNDLQNALRVARGRYGFRIGVRAENGTNWFCCADNVEVIK